MWNKVIFLLGIKVSEQDYANHLDELFLLNDWVIERYGNKLTCEDVKLAYDMALTGKLPIKEVFSILSPKHVGIVLDAYLTFAQGDAEVNRVYKFQQLNSGRPDRTEDEVNDFMEFALAKAIEEVRHGKFYNDPGNGLFHWLWLTGRIVIGQERQQAYLNKAKAVIPEDYKVELNQLDKRDRKVQKLELLLEAIENGMQPKDYVSRVQEYAKRLTLNDYLKSLL